MPCIVSLFVVSLFASSASGITLKGSSKRLVDDFFYLRNPKAGSSSAVLMFKEAHASQPEQCAHLEGIGHGHETTVDLFEQACPGARTFTIIREPCERFMSQWEHLSLYVENHGVNKFGRPSIRTPCEDIHSDEHTEIMEALQTPLSFAKALQKSSSLRAMFLAREPMRFFERCKMSVVGYKQSNYVSDNTSVACLPTMATDLQHILRSNVNTQDCVLPPAEHMNDRSTLGNKHNASDVDHEVCKLVKDVYSEDVKLWNEHCAHLQK